MSSLRFLVLQVHSQGFIQVDGTEVLLDWPWPLLPSPQKESFVVNFSFRTVKITMPWGKKLLCYLLEA